MQIRNLTYLLALDRERHFARAAEACHVSQPTLSAGIAALEEQLGRRLVERDRRFIGFTSEGMAVLPWARQVISALDGLAHAADASAGPLRGQLRLGAIPASMPIAGAFATRLQQSEPRLHISICSLTSREIADQLHRYELDAGLTYISHEPLSQMIAVPLYAERMLFVERANGARTGRKTIAIAEALGRPLCLLHQGMQNRRILDQNLARCGQSATPAITADSYVALLALVQTGAYATIMPDSYGPLLPPWARMSAFEQPLEASQIGLVVPERSPLGPLALVALEVGRAMRMRAS